ncbi:hypothetical protein JR316_0002161 [Psilocybe cubensis]|uniref:Uncharacterized protein n=2 Tax=Psilocybe cubensis TaxID=181762 RepID=A0A8H8CPA5_PSICU|nr:hypothetical protein JR316_0002161 [Psilocybe cubensis]KAH9485254.1 hypothetical protein JR316_0002161 [Psilocybe cubensis]
MKSLEIFLRFGVIQLHLFDVVVDEINFPQHLQTKYQDVKSLYPTEGRRKWCLRVLYDSWPQLSTVSSHPNTAGAGPTGQASYESDPDPTDPVLEDEELGLIIRTDFTNDDAWNSFCGKVQAAQKELLSDLSGGGAEAAAEGGSDVAMDGVPPPPHSVTPDDADDESDSSSEGADIVKILDPSDPADRLKLTDISNLAALRLFNDVDIRPAPIPPTGTKRISPWNPLIDQSGWQEIYRGKNLWIYDSKSITDECVRVVGQEGNFYGTATGDSWRARGTHVPELQFNMTYQGMKIDFNGLDKWDWNERARNLNESSTL